MTNGAPYLARTRPRLLGLPPVMIVRARVCGLSASIVLARGAEQHERWHTALGRVS